jgi:O-antigen/teichoic acid export membrane protein
VSETDLGQVPHIDDPLEAGEAGGKVIRGGGLRAAAHVTGILVGLISAPLVVRHLGPVGYGRFVTVTSIIYIVTGLTEGGLANVAIRQYATGDRRERAAIIGNLQGLRIVLCGLGLIGALIFGELAGYPQVVVAGIALGGVALLINSLQAALNTALISGLRLSAVAGIELMRSLTTTLFFLILVLLGSELLGFYFVAGAVAIPAWAVTAWLVRRDVPLTPRFNRERFRMLLRETALYAAATALAAVYFQVAVVSMSLLSNGRQTGFYAAAFRVIDLANGVPWVLAGSVFPVIAYAAASDSERLRYVVHRSTDGALLVGGSFAVIIIIGAGFGMKIVGGDEFNASVPVLRILGLGVTATFLVAVWGFVLLSQQRYRELIAANGVALLLAIVLSVTLIPEFGAKGGGATTAALEITLATIYGALLARRGDGLQPRARALLRVLVAIGVGLGVGAALLGVGAVLATIVAVCAYAAVMWFTGGVPPELLEAVQRRRAA